jgi:uroporphyrinogen III methyltransferase/synthase
VDVEVVPGISAALGVPAYAGVPLTHRRIAPCFTVVTGHVALAPADEPGGNAQPPAPEPDWDALARLGGTIVILMGAGNRSEIAARLANGGRPAATPVLVVESGTLPAQRTVRTTLAALAGAEVGAPATIVVGEVAALGEAAGEGGEALGWFERRPLFGWTVVVTRARAQAFGLVTALAAAGATAVELPSIAIADPADGGAALRRAAGRLGDYDWVVLTSANAVERLAALLRDARDFGAAQVAAIGTGTAAALAGRGIVADLVPERFVAESLLESFPAAPAAGGRVLLPRAAVAREVLPQGLSAKGWTVDVVEAYRSERPQVDDDLVAAARSADAVAFTASSTVTGFLEIVGGGRSGAVSGAKAPFPPVVACIGPVTAATARSAGLDVEVVAAVHSIAGLVEALSAWARANGRPGR